MTPRDEQQPSSHANNSIGLIDKADGLWPGPAGRYASVVLGEGWAVTFFDYPTGDAEPAARAQAFLPDAPERDWADLLRLATVRRLVAGETLLAPGSTDRSLFIVLEGQLEVLSPAGRKWRHVATVGAGSLVGELAFFDGGVRSALVRPVADSSVAELSIDNFGVLQRTRPDLAMAVVLDVGRILAQRMRLVQATV